MRFTNSYIRAVSLSFMAINGREARVDNISSPLFRGFITIDTSKEYFEVPTAITEFDMASFTIELEKFPIKVFPLYVGKDIGTLSTGDSILKTFMSVAGETRLVKVKTSKGDTYYGGKGIVLDENFNPLVLCTYKSSFKVQEGIIQRVIELHNKIVHIHPNVFLDPSRVLNKAIINRFMPFVLSYSTRAHYTKARIRDYTHGTTPTIIIDDMSSIFSKITPPTPTDESESTLINKFLSKNEHLITVE